MKKLFLFTAFLLCLFAGMTVSATDYIVSLTVPVSETDIAETEIFKEIGKFEGYLYVTDNLEVIKQLEEMKLVIYYEEDAPVEFIDEAPVQYVKDMPMTFSASYTEEFNENKASYIAFTNNLVARDGPKGEYTVRVGVVDSGISIYDANGNSREDFSNVVAGVSFVDSNPFKDTINHGTPVAGLIGGKFSGVAPDCEMISLKAFSGSEGSVSAVASAIKSGVDVFGCKVLNISAGIDSKSIALTEAVEYAVSKNVIVVAAVGNDGHITSEITYPAGNDKVIGVGAVDSNGNHSSFSRKNASNDVCAIGSSVYTTFSTDYSSDKYNVTSGTSFSAPQVAGLAALLCSFNPHMTQDEFLKILEATCFDPGESGYDITYGHGIIDVKEALMLVTQNPEIYSSRIFANGNNINYKIYNNTPNAKTFTIIKANYELFGSIISFEPVEITVNSKEVVPVSDIITYNSASNEYFRLMLWQSIEKMTPLYKTREYW